MLVDWSLASYEGGEGVLFADVGVADGPCADVSHDTEGKFLATVSSKRYSSGEVIQKTDPSLIELMNWVEEELKFRMRE